MRTSMRGDRPLVGPGARVGAIVALVLLAGACSSAESGEGNSDAAASSTSMAASSSSDAQTPEPVQQLDIDGTEYTFAVSPDPSGGLRPGWTEVRFDNVGHEAHQVMFARLKDGVDMAELAAAGEGDSSGASAIEFVDMIGGVSYIDPERDTSALVDLSEGTVVAMCYVPNPDGVAHTLLGMSTILAVSPADAPPPTTPGADPAPADPGSTPAREVGEREVVGTIELAAEGYLIPDDPGPGWYHVVNTDVDAPGGGLHELSLLRLEGPVGRGGIEQVVDDLANNITPSVGLDAVGGMGAISAGFDGYLYLDLTPGEYLAVDFMPDPGEPRPHMLDGYYAEFSVEA